MGIAKIYRKVKGWRVLTEGKLLCIMKVCHQNGGREYEKEHPAIEIDGNPIDMDDL